MLDILLSLSLQLTLVQQRLQEVEAIRHSIEMCESGGNQKAVNWADAIINGSPSRGVMQFWEPTYIENALQYQVASSIKEAKAQYWSADSQRRVAWMMIAHGETYHWKNCYQKYLHAKT